MAAGVRIVGVVIALLALPVALLTYATGHIIDGWDPAGTQCFHLLGSPPIPIDAPGEDGGETGSFTEFPLGVACTFDVAGDGIPPQTLQYANWDATLMLLYAIQAVAVGAVMVMAPGIFAIRRTPRPGRAG